MPNLRLPFFCGLVLLAPPVAPWLHAAFPNLQLELLAEGQFNSPTSVVHAGDGSGRLFITDQRGRIHLFRDGAVLPVPFLDLAAKLVPERSGFDERGLLGLAFHPDYATAAAPGAGRFYVFYNAPSPNAPGPAAAPVDCMSVISEFKVSAANPDLADPASERVLLSFDKPQFNHNGGQLAFGPSDALLYVATGDGGSSNDNNAGHTGGSAARPTTALGNAQDRTNLLGKLLRIDPLATGGPGGQYGIPAGNPFVGAGGGVREEIFAYGLRNPWRFSFDDGPGGTGRLFCADVGQGNIEEINLIVAGGNYGWRNKEGTSFPAFSAGAPPLTGTVVDPVVQYAHPGVAIGTPALPQIGISVTGGHVYRGSAIPGLAGKYVFADWSTAFATPSGTLLGLEETSPGVFSLAVLTISGGNPLPRYIPTLGEDQAGEIYVATKTSQAVSAPDPSTGLPAGQLFRLAAAPAPVNATLGAARDNAIYSENGSLSNGVGSFLFTGRIATTTPTHRRSVIAFDLSAVPAGSTITAAKLRLSMDRTTSGASNVTIHRLTSNWGEGSSNAGEPGGGGTAATTGDATWTFAFFDTVPWTTAGGDFQAAASATTSVNAIGRYEWSSAGLVADVQGWVNGTTPNHGWLLKGDESATSAKRFAAREHTTPADRPTLDLTWSPATQLTRRQQWERQFYPAGTFLDPDADTDGDTIPLLLEYAWDLDPTRRDSSAQHFSVHVDHANDRIDLSFLRDPRATDLDYVLEASSDLLDWDALATSSAGAPASGPGFQSDAPDPTRPPLHRVTARDTLTLSAGKARFFRLRVVRP